MKIKQITLRNYKKFVKLRTISFTNPQGEINNEVLILGDNGSGKTSILQAIVAVVASVTRENFSLDHIDWPGYEYRHLQTGLAPLVIEVEIVFSDTEIRTTIDYAKELQEMGVQLGVPPSDHQCLTLSLDFGHKRVQVKGHRGAAPVFQFAGHQYAKRLASMRPNKSTFFENVGNIYWYNEQRNSYSLSNLLDTEQPQINFIRTFLSSAYSYHLAIESGDRVMQPGEFDFYSKMENIYSKVFPGRSFVGAAPRFDIFEQSKASDFFLYDGKNQYELSGMSAGERAIFPILMDFARWNINNSIIIIDELELHLHPPLQQTLVRVLSQLGNNNQFILTSHSNAVAAMFDEEENQIIRLPNE